MVEQKLYCGNGKMIETKIGKVMKFSLSPKDIEQINMYAQSNKGWVNLDILKRKEPSEKGTTHYGVISTWKPKERDDGSVVPEAIPDNETPF